MERLEFCITQNTPNIPALKVFMQELAGLINIAVEHSYYVSVYEASKADVIAACQLVDGRYWVLDHTDDEICTWCGNWYDGIEEFCSLSCEDACREQEDAECDRANEMYYRSFTP